MNVATLRELNNNSSALARRAQAGETIVVTDRGAPIADITPHHGTTGGASREAVAQTFERLAAVLAGDANAALVRADLDAVVDPYVDL